MRITARAGGNGASLSVPKSLLNPCCRNQERFSAVY